MSNDAILDYHNDCEARRTIRNAGGPVVLFPPLLLGEQVEMLSLAHDGRKTIVNLSSPFAYVSDCFF